MPQVSPPAHYLPSPEQLAEAALRGLGYAVMPDLQAAAEIKRGRLIELDQRGRLETALYWYRWNRPSALLDRFSRLILAEGRRMLA